MSRWLARRIPADLRADVIKHRRGVAAIFRSVFGGDVQVTSWLSCNADYFFTTG